MSEPPTAETSTTSASHQTLTLAPESPRILFGERDENLRRVEAALGVTLGARGERLRIEGSATAVEQATRMFTELDAMIAQGRELGRDDVETALRVLTEEPQASLIEFFSGDGILGKVRRLLTPRSLQQQLYLKAMADDDLVIAIGPAGTGKTFLAVAMAAAALEEGLVRRIILARPAVEAGEKLGFLPGDLAEKVNPYLRPLFDALYDLVGFERSARMLERGIIEVAPVAFMRGRTLNDSFIILDEAQNTTSEQMKMFLTRIGFNSRAVVTGDVTQIDLPSGTSSGLKEARQILDGVAGIQFIHFTQRDVVRHRLVQKIVRAYDLWENRAAGVAKSENE